LKLVLYCIVYNLQYIAEVLLA